MATLQGRTEGWIAALQLAALSLQEASDPAGQARTFAGPHRSIVDYLMEQVLRRQDAAVQEFLLATSILDRLSGPLCDAVRGEAARRLIAAGKTYQEIARELIIAVSTVQYYVKSLYPKLGVHSGLEAVARARQLGLLL